MVNDVKHHDTSASVKKWCLIVCSESKSVSNIFKWTNHWWSQKNTHTFLFLPEVVPSIYNIYFIYSVLTKKVSTLYLLERRIPKMINLNFLFFKKWKKNRKKCKIELSSFLLNFTLNLLFFCFCPQMSTTIGTGEFLGCPKDGTIIYTGCSFSLQVNEW